MISKLYKNTFFKLINVEGKPNVFDLVRSGKETAQVYIDSVSKLKQKGL